MGRGKNDNYVNACFSCYWINAFTCMGITLIAAFLMLLLIPAAILTAKYTHELGDYKYSDKYHCNVKSVYVLNETCSRDCNCKSCGKYECCDTCNYECYRGCWGLNVTDVDVSTRICTNSNENMDIIHSQLEKYQLNNTYNCYANDSPYDLKWNKDEYPAAYETAIIILWSIIGFIIVAYIITLSVHFVICISTHWSNAIVDDN